VSVRRPPIGRDAFVASRRERWERLERLLVDGPSSASEWSELAGGYRALCADLSIARSAGMPSDVQDVLDDLAGRAHNRLYAVRPTGWGAALVHDALVGFPRELRLQWRFFLLSTVLFYGPFVLGGVWAAVDPSFAATVLTPEMVEQMERMYSSAEQGRGFGGDVTMAGFYVLNNVGIAFRCFATGALFGIGSIYCLVYNGLVIGTVAGHLGGAGLGGNLLSFVAGHAAWELTGVCVAGAAGLRLGWALVATGGSSRAGSVRRASGAIYRLVVGAAFLLLVAAAIEGFWSAGPMPFAARLVFGAAQIVIVAGWLAFGGRTR
jgi:uncharacterized membrane protein SpoIIM required for sporulation